MNLKQIDKMAKNKAHLTDEQKMKLAKAILKNEKAKNIAINGALSNNDFSLAVKIMQGTF